MDATTGSAFRRAREGHELSVEAIADELDVEARHLRAIEDGTLEDELGPALTRAKTKLYALFLGLDGKTLLAGLPAGTPAATSPAAALAGRAAGSASGSSPASSDRSPFARPPADEPSADDTIVVAPAATSRLDHDDDAPWQPPPLAPAGPSTTGEDFFAENDEDELYDDVGDDAYRRRRALGIVGGLLALALIAGFLFSVLGGQDDIQLTDEDLAVTEEEAAEEPADEPADDEPAPVEEEPAADPAPGAPAGAGDTSVQVLDGVGDRVAYQQAIAYLTDLGYQVEPSGGSAREYAQTTLFFSEGRDDRATALAETDSARFSVVAPNDRGLSEDIDLHIVVGADWPLEDGTAEAPAEDAADAEDAPAEG